MLPGRAQLVILIPWCTERTFLWPSQRVLCLLPQQRDTVQYETGVALLSRAFLSISGQVLPSPWPKTHSQPRARSVLSTSEGCNLSEASVMTLLLWLNSWLSCGVIWVRATNLAEPQTLKDMPPTKVAMICSTVSSERAVNFTLSLC